MEHMSLDNAPLGSDSVPVTPAREGTTIRTPQVRRVSSRQVSGAAKQPLGLDMSFGNGKSTVRQFQRVRSDVRPSTPPHHGHHSESDLLSPQDSVFDSDAENKPPPPPNTRQNSGERQAASAVPATKEALLGRRAYALCIDPALQETHAATADRTSRDALGRVAEALSRLDELDPEGELLLLKSILDRVQADPKLSRALLPQLSRPASSVRHPSTSLASKRASVITVIDTTDLSIRNNEPPSTPSSSSPSKSANNTSSAANLGTPTRSPSKLVLNPQNPHLKKMRSSQAHQQVPGNSQQPATPSSGAPERERAAGAAAALEEKMPGTATEPGMEHTGMLADVLYGRWAEGLRARWPLA